MLVLISCEQFLSQAGGTVLDSLIKAVLRITREIDVLGWYERDMTLGLLMTEIGEANSTTIDSISNKILTAIRAAIAADMFRMLTFQFRVFPKEVEKTSNTDENNIHFPDISRQDKSKSPTGHILKRGVDIAGSLFALIALAPLFLFIGTLIKLTSHGPVLFCQKRVGRYGKEFKFYKFRTMYDGNDPQIHQEYVAKLIAGNLSEPNRVYKLVNDPRITPIGRYLRKTSLDEFPQFVNVLKNDMSLVGPRPPLPYEFERYQTWHKRRVLELKPGLTGLWQIEGRSRTTFDEMVRMDLGYAIHQSLWVDIKIILQTPSAMFSGRGAC
jgi:lipopolysaccharide/colanic/teichoic acid biosynthesis glycosyltransferase